MDGFYYKGLNREEKSAYEQMLAGFKSLAPTIRITRLEPARLAEVYLRLKLDTPLLFHVTGYSYRFYPGESTWSCCRNTCLTRERFAPTSRQ